MQVGDTVKVLAPFNAAYPDSYSILAVNGDGTVQVNLPGYEDMGGSTFDPVYLQKVS